MYVCMYICTVYVCTCMISVPIPHRIGALLNTDYSIYASRSKYMYVLQYIYSLSFLTLYLFATNKVARAIRDEVPDLLREGNRQIEERVLQRGRGSSLLLCLHFLLVSYFVPSMYSFTCLLKR